MSVLEKLKEKIDALKIDFHRIQVENQDFKDKVGNSTEEIASLQKGIADRDQSIARLQNEIAEKDKEIEAIIAKVETLLA